MTLQAPLTMGFSLPSPGDLNWGSFKFALVFTPLLSALLGSQSESLHIYSSPSPWFSDSQKIMSTGLETDLHFPQVDTAPIS